MKTLQQLLEERATLVAQIDSIDNAEKLKEHRFKLEKIDLQIVEAQKVAEEQERGAQKPAAQTQADGLRATFQQGQPNTQQPAKKEEKAADPYDTPEYRKAFMQYCQRGTPIPKELRASAVTSTADAAAVIPTTTLNEIIQKLETSGEIYAKVRKLNIQGGVKIPILSLKPTATWIGESTVSDTQKIESKTSVSFSYYGLECRISQTLLASVVTFDTFQALFVPLATEAIIKALDLAVFNGEGTASPLGITKDTRVITALAATNVITLTPTDFSKWSGWKKKVFAKMKKAYRKGDFFMAQGTFDGYIDGMEDTTGQPIGRVNYGIDGAEQYRFGGKDVVTVEDDIITAYDDAEVGDIVAVFADLSNYVINSNMQMSVVQWTDHDTNEVKTKVILIVDGKLLDPNGVLIIKKGAAA